MPISDQERLSQNVNSLLNLPQAKLLETVNGWGQVLSRDGSTQDSESILSTYRLLLQRHATEFKNKDTNNFAIHFLHLAAWAQIQGDNPREARSLLKNIEQYILLDGCDSMLLALALHNLAVLTKQAGKPKKALSFGFQAVNSLLTHMREAKTETSNDDNYDMIPLIAALGLCRQLLCQLQETDLSFELRDWEINLNHFGLRLALKHAGKNSPLTKKFSLPLQRFYLPMCMPDEKELEKSQNATKGVRKEANFIQDPQPKFDNIPAINKSSKQPNTPKPKEQPSLIPKVKLQNELIISSSISKRIEKEKQPNNIAVETNNSKKENEKVPTEIKLNQAEQNSKVPIRQSLTVPQHVLDMKTSYKANDNSLGSGSIEESFNPPSIKQSPSNSNPYQSKIGSDLVLSQGSSNGSSNISSIDTKNNAAQNINSQEEPSFFTEKQSQIDFIWNQINFRDVVPYQDLDEVSSDRHTMSAYINLFKPKKKSSNSSSIVYCHSLGIFGRPLEFRMLEEDCFVFVNHIYHNYFRLAVCPKKMAQTAYLQVFMSATMAAELFTSLPEMENIDILTIRNALTQASPRTSEGLKLKSKELCELYFLKLLVDFERFLQQSADEISIWRLLTMDQIQLYHSYEERAVKKTTERINVVLSTVDNVPTNQPKQGTDSLKMENPNAANGSEKDLLEYSVQLCKSEGTFSSLKYYRRSKRYDVYMEHSWDSYCQEGLSRARGLTSYSNEKYKEDFGIPLGSTTGQILAVAEMLRLKYSLFEVRRPLQPHQLEAYSENAIIQKPFTAETNKTKLISKGNYFDVLRAELLCINAEIPIGIRLYRFCPQTCRMASIFVTLNSSEWLQPEVPVSKMMRKSPIDSHFIKIRQQWRYKQDYFIGNWLERFGFSRLLEMMRTDSKLSLPAKENSFIRIKEILIDM